MLWFVCMACILGVELLSKINVSFHIKMLFSLLGVVCVIIAGIKEFKKDITGGEGEIHGKTVKENTKKKFRKKEESEEIKALRAMQESLHDFNRAVYNEGEMKKVDIERAQTYRNFYLTLYEGIEHDAKKRAIFMRFLEACDLLEQNPNYDNSCYFDEQLELMKEITKGL